MAIEAGKRVRVGGKTYEVYAKSEDKTNRSWWCLPIRGGKPSFERGWRAFHEEDMKELK